MKSSREASSNRFKSFEDEEEHPFLQDPNQDEEKAREQEFVRVGAINVVFEERFRTAMVNAFRSLVEASQAAMQATHIRGLPWVELQLNELEKTLNSLRGIKNETEIDTPKPSRSKKKKF